MPVMPAALHGRHIASPLIHICPAARASSLICSHWLLASFPVRLPPLNCRNVARREMERLRTALNWELAPVIADFSPAFNAEAPTIFDKAG